MGTERVTETLSGKRVAVIGLGLSGVAAATLCLKRGANVVGVDSCGRQQLSEAARGLADAGAELALGLGDDELRSRLAVMDLIVVSPGVPPSSALASAETSGVPIWSEVELAFREFGERAPILAVGGTNGKSTTTALVHALLAETGRKVFIGGNYGEPFSLHVDEAWDAVVLEVSSFQMERVSSFKPKSCILLNVTADHLDRYDGMDAYAHAKGNAFAAQSEGDLAVIPFGDDVCRKQAARGKAAVITFGPGGDIDVTADAVIDRLSGVSFERKGMALTGGHNALNVAAAIAAVRPFSVSATASANVLRSFGGLPHRTAFVAEVGGVRYYDDSKGTNVGASVTALVGLVEPKAVLIAGGRDKGGSYAPLVDALRTKGRAAVLIGEAADAMATAIGATVPVAKAASMADAVRKAAAFANPGDAVLLSPACSSFDMFRDYKHRGDAFVEAVHLLREEARS